MKKFVSFFHISLLEWKEVSNEIEKAVNNLEQKGYKILSISFTGSGMVACVFYRKTIWKAIKDSFWYKGDINI